MRISTFIRAWTFIRNPRVARQGQLPLILTWSIWFFRRTLFNSENMGAYKNSVSQVDRKGVRALFLHCAHMVATLKSALIFSVQFKDPYYFWKTMHLRDTVFYQSLNKNWISSPVSRYWCTFATALFFFFLCFSLLMDWKANGPLLDGVINHFFKIETLFLKVTKGKQQVFLRIHKWSGLEILSCKSIKISYFSDFVWLISRYNYVFRCLKKSDTYIQWVKKSEHSYYIAM